eukprot:TRINITY_DN14758_c0_g1_i1.p1 TRINITY_DN14758_c0_g1~~TRINITY_DN14758_c0_g1_i1.p1  ORF type:complete len:335 (+),score=42.16 TRINITY_DN14758_c0_g1_i1:54-1058(+)
MTKAQSNVEPINEKEDDDDDEGGDSPSQFDEHPVASVGFIYVGSILGVYLRHVLQDPSEYAFYSYVFPNFLGSTLAGFMKKFGSERLPHRSVSIGVGIGLCGSLTSFSSWMKAAAVLVGPEPVLTSDFHKVYLAVQICVVGAAVGIAGYDFGAVLGCVLSEHYTTTKSSSLKRIHFLVLSVAAAITTAAVVVSFTVWEETVLLVALCTGPLGALCRWKLSTLNTIYPSFPMGTFVANMLACALLATVYVLQLGEFSSGTVSCTVLHGVANGFCGSLSTVSTFVTELRSIACPLRSLAYGVASVASAQLIMMPTIAIYAACVDDALQNGTACIYQ